MPYCRQWCLHSLTWFLQQFIHQLNQLSVEIWCWVGRWHLILTNLSNNMQRKQERIKKNHRMTVSINWEIRFSSLRWLKNKLTTCIANREFLCKGHVICKWTCQHFSHQLHECINAHRPYNMQHIIIIDIIENVMLVTYDHLFEIFERYLCYLNS